MALYADLRKTQAELDEQRRAGLDHLHTPKNYAVLKVDVEPQAPRKPEDFLPTSPIGNMSTEQVVGFRQAAGHWDNAQAATYRQEQAARTPNMQLVENEGHTTRAREYMLEQNAHAMPAEEVAKRYEQAGKREEAETFKRQQAVHTINGDDEARDSHRKDGARDVLKLEQAAERRKALDAEKEGAKRDALAGKGYEQLHEPNGNGPHRDRGGRGR